MDGQLLELPGAGVARWGGGERDGAIIRFLYSAGGGVALGLTNY